MIELKNLCKSYYDHTVFQNANYTFPKKGLVCIMGSSGSGKSTLLNIIAGFDRNYTGSIKVGTTLLSSLKGDELCSYRREHIGFIFQDYHLLKGYTVLENILLSSTNEETFEHDKTLALKFLKDMDLYNKKDQYVENLSGGQKQRVSIIRALIKNPTMIFADEPTGALDRKNATEIISILKDISKDRLVIVITHDYKICSYADETLQIKDGTILSENKINDASDTCSLSLPKSKKEYIWKRSIKNFQVHFKRYLAVSIAISIGIFCFMLSLSFNNVIETSINAFKSKNTSFNNGFIKLKSEYDTSIEDKLAKDNRIKNIYKQYKIKNVTLSLGEKEEIIDVKAPIPKATKSMSYGSMPKQRDKGIALSPSLAKKFSNEIHNLIGNKIVLSYDGKQYSLTVRGIFNTEFDDFFVSSEIEQSLYKKQKGNAYSISYDVPLFEDVVPVSHMLDKKGIPSENASKQVFEFQHTFQMIKRLFYVISSLILIICLFIATLLLNKLYTSRRREIALLSALGFTYAGIRNVIIMEGCFLSFTSFVLYMIWIIIYMILSSIWNLSLEISLYQVIFSAFITFFTIAVINFFTSYKLLRTDPADALR